jgi:hypothetical protein
VERDIIIATGHTLKVEFFCTSTTMVSSKMSPKSVERRNILGSLKNAIGEFEVKKGQLIF